MGMTIKITLAVDRSRNRVLFADAGSDFVGVLLSFLALPLSAVHPVAGLSSPGCLANLRDSVSHLRKNKLLLKVDACHCMLLMSTHTDEFKLCKPPCEYNDGVFVKHCKCGCQFLARLLHVYTGLSNGEGEAFLRGKERFVISDDWAIKPASTSSLLSLPQTLGSDGVGHGFEEVQVSVGLAEVVSMLEASLSSDTIFTDVFLPEGKVAHVTAKPSIHQRIMHQSNTDPGSSPSPECKIKLFYDRHEKKVMYAECDHAFVDLLLGFLAYPLGHVIKNTGGAANCHLGRSLDNLYSSAIDLDATGFLTGRFPRETLQLDPNLITPFNMGINVMCPALDCRCMKDRVTNIASTHVCHPELVEDRKYVVDDDLLIHQASAMSVMKHWRRRYKANVVEMDITIGKQEAVVLMQAVFNSKMALTDVFMSRLEEQSMPAPPSNGAVLSSTTMMQIYVKTYTNETVSVMVETSDTIATLKSRINNKVPFPTEFRNGLIHNGRYLEDSWTVARCNIARASTLIQNLLPGVRPPFTV